MRKEVYLLALALSACAIAPPLTPKAEKIQMHEQDSVLVASCKMVGPVDVQVKRVLPAQDVVDLAYASAREQAAFLDADSLVITNVEHFAAGLANGFKVQGSAMNCYPDNP